MKFVSVAEMQAIEQEANASGFTYPQMMEHAGKNLAEVVLDKLGYLEEEGILGLVGSGNNGGDTLVALAYLAEQGWKACALIVRPRPSDDPLIQQLLNHGGKVYWIDRLENFEIINSLLQENGVLLDGVLGTGIRLPLKPELAQILDYTRKTLKNLEKPPFVVAVDCPSGIDCDTGQAASECIPADLTVTMAAIKRGLYNFPAYNLIGELVVVDIGLPDGGENYPSWRNIQTFVPEAEWVRKMLPSRPLDAHKGTFGTALIVAGSTHYTGAVLLAGEAAYRIGAGLVTLAVPSPLHTALASALPEATWLPLPHQNGFISAEAVNIVLQNLSRATTILIGPGFGLEDTTAEFLANLLIPKKGEKISPSPLPIPPLVVDADGLKLLTRQKDWFSFLPKPAILTPHPGEMGILTGLSKEEIQADRIKTAQEYSRQWGHVVVLKGAFTVIADPSGQTAIIPVATPALARAGTGDVLAGLIAGLRAQGVDAFPSATVGAWIHAFAGLHAARARGDTTSVLASDVLRSATEVIAEIQ